VIEDAKIKQIISLQDWEDSLSSSLAEIGESQFNPLKKGNLE
jgi:hypothetical protein